MMQVEFRKSGAVLPVLMTVEECRAKCYEFIETTLGEELTREKDDEGNENKACVNFFACRGARNPDCLNRLLHGEPTRWGVADSGTSTPVFTFQNGTNLTEQDYYDLGWKLATIHEGRNDLNTALMEETMHTIVKKELKIPWGRRLNARIGGFQEVPKEVKMCFYGLYVLYHPKGFGKGYGDLKLRDEPKRGKK